MCLCCVAGDLLAGGDAATSSMLPAASCDEHAEPGLRSWPPKSHTSGAPVPGNTASPQLSVSCGRELSLLQILRT